MAKTTLKENQANKQTSSVKNTEKQSGHSILIHLVIVFLSILQWCTIIYEFPKEYNYIIKPSVVLTMCLYTILTSHNGAKAFKYLMVIGFFFSALGDIFLLFDGMQFFMLGLISFAIAHIAFFVGFFENSSFDTKLFVSFSGPLGVLLAVYGYFMFTHLTTQQGFPEFMKIPVLAYCVLISTMAFAASMRDKTNKKSYILGFIGALFFISSDSILSFNIFVNGYETKLYKFLIMFTYYIAEELIFIASIHHYKHASQPIAKKTD